MLVLTINITNNSNLLLPLLGRKSVKGFCYHFATNIAFLLTHLFFKTFNIEEFVHK